MASVAATELAKLGKCEALIRTRRQQVSRSGGATEFRAVNAATLRGEVMHRRYEAELERFMTAPARRKRLALNTLLATAVGGVFTLLLVLHIN